MASGGHNVVIDPAQFGDADVRFERYPYGGASVHPSGLVRVDAIRDVDPDATPPEIRLSTGETLFVPAQQKDGLRAFAERHAIRVIRRPDLWALLLEPFLDTEFGAEHRERTLVRLEEQGIARAEALRIRRSVAPSMLAYNAAHWDWVHLGLADLLAARDGFIAHLRSPLGGQSQRDFYGYAMEIADRAHSVGEPNSTES